MNQETARNILAQTKQSYNLIAPEFSGTRSFVWEELKPLSDLVKAGDKVLDVGCGNGRLYELLKDKGVQYIGIDSSENLIALAHKKWVGTSAKFLVQDILQGGLTLQGNFDAIFCIAVLHHIPSRALRQEAVQRLYAALKPGGTLILTAWNLWQSKFWGAHLRQVSARFNFWRLNLQKLDFGDLWVPWKGNAAPAVKAYRYYHAFTQRELRRLLQSGGFQIQKQYFVKKGEQAGWQGIAKMYNMVVVAKK